MEPLDCLLRSHQLLKKWLILLSEKIVGSDDKIKVEVSRQRVYIRFRSQNSSEYTPHQLEIEYDAGQGSHIIRLIFRWQPPGENIQYFDTLVDHHHPCFPDLVQFREFAESYSRLSALQQTVLFELHSLMAK